MSGDLASRDCSELQRWRECLYLPGVWRGPWAERTGPFGCKIPGLAWRKVSVLMTVARGRADRGAYKDV